MMHKRLKDFLQNPSTRAYAGYWATVLKAGIGLLMGLVFSILMQKNFCLGFLYLSYPVVALIVDIVLYRFKDKLWHPLPPNTILPREWKITALELVQYAKQSPKIRLLRLRFIPILMVSLYLLFFLIGDGAPRKRLSASG